MYFSRGAVGDCGSLRRPMVSSLSPLDESLMQIGMCTMGCNCRESIDSDVNG